MKKNMLLVLVIAVAVAGIGIIIGSESFRFNEGFGHMGRTSPMALALLGLPFVVLFYFLGKHLHKKSQERKWKNAIVSSRDRKQDNE
jgi:hypothetical protein